MASNQQQRVEATFPEPGKLPQSGHIGNIIVMPRRAVRLQERGNLRSTGQIQPNNDREKGISKESILYVANSVLGTGYLTITIRMSRTTTARQYMKDLGKSRT